MARLRRQIGITGAEVRLPQQQSVGPAIIKTASNFAQRAYDKKADQRTQEAQIAARAINFERDGDGNLTAPRLPIAANGMIAPSIYDRAYTKMVSTKYLNQIKIDTSAQLNMIASKFVNDPSGYQKVAEGYVAKVTDLAPEILKTDVNQAAQMTMVEHFNRIVRVTSEKDHAESKDLSVKTLNLMGDELHDYQISGASDDVVAAQVMKLRANIFDGRDVRDGGSGFYSEAEMMTMRSNLDRQVVLNQMIGTVSGLPDDGDVEHVRMFA